jgi:hypothetical protein
MSIPLSASKVLDREYLTMRCKVIDLAAALDRIDRAAGDVADNPRIALIRRSLDILGGDAPDRTERIQQVFSLPCEAEG